MLEEVDLDDAPMVEELPEEDYDDLDEYSFSKFASMYFQGAATPTHVRQRLRQPLLYHEEENDVVVNKNFGSSVMQQFESAAGLAVALKTKQI